MEAIKHYLSIESTPERVFQAIATEDGLKSWWAKQSNAKPELGFVNTFTFGKFRHEMEVTEMVPYQKVEWKCISSIEEWVGTKLSFDLKEKDGKTILRFSHTNWKSVTDTFAKCNYDWAQFLRSLKLVCETGTGVPA